MSIVGSKMTIFFYKIDQITLYALREGLQDKALSISKDYQNRLDQSSVNQRSQWVSHMGPRSSGVMHRSTYIKAPCGANKYVNTFFIILRFWSTYCVQFCCMVKRKSVDWWFLWGSSKDLFWIEQHSYWFPISPFVVSSVRSSYSHPDLLLIHPPHHPLFQ